MKTKLTLFVLLLSLSITAQVEKLDLLPNYTAIYNNQMQLIRINDTTTVSDFNVMFADSCDLVTLNVSIPIKRLMKFYGIKDAIPGAYIEVPYSTMTAEQKQIFDNFVAENE